MGFVRLAYLPLDSLAPPILLFSMLKKRYNTFGFGNTDISTAVPVVNMSMTPYSMTPSTSRSPYETLAAVDSEGHLRQDLILVPTASFIFGFVSGLMTSSHLSSRQFLAENAHRLPTTVQGWYFYQKTKNYRVLYGGMKGGLKTGSRLAAWTGAFVGLEEGIEYGVRMALPDSLSNQPTRWACGALAGLTLAGLAGQFYRLSRYGGARRLMLGASLGGLAGGSHDLRSWLKTRIPDHR